MRRISKAFVLTTVIALASGTFMGSALAALSRFLIEDFGLSNAQFGLLPTIFTLGGTLSVYFIGRVADRVGGRNLLRVHLALCLAGILAAAVAGSYAWLLVSVAAAGLGSTSANPATNRLIAANVPARVQATVVGIKATGQPLAVIVAGAILPTAAMAWSWRASLALGAMFPLAGMALMSTVPIDEPDTAFSRARDTRNSRRAVRWIAINGFFVGGAAAAVVSFLPLFGQETIGLSATEAGALLSAAGLTSLIGRLLWGRIAGRFKHVNVALSWLSVFSIAATVALVLSGSLDSIFLVWVAAAVAGLTMLSWNALGMTAVVSEVEIAASGRASGTVMSAFLGGWMTTPFVFGWTLDVTGSFTVGWLIVLGFNVAAVAPLLLWQRDPKPILHT